MPTNNDVIRANKKYEGQTCAICKKEIILGDLIHICPNCQSVNHEECWQNEGGCNSLSCNSLSVTQPRTNVPMNNAFANNSSMGMAQTAGRIPANMVPCRFCKEPIMRGARKCKHCGEYQNESDRTSFVGNQDDTLSVTDILAIVCCPGFIGIVVGTIHCSKYQVEKGVKVLKYSLIWSVVSGMLFGVLQQILIAAAQR